ncbi:MAG: hypothetical protein P8J87_08405 [Verrucomicrobiales bacterium]|nr:hypothetical protein [Verrucomicrobiales bacterium]
MKANTPLPICSRHKIPKTILSPVRYDSLTFSVGWDDAAEHNLWFANAETNLTGFVSPAQSAPHPV